MFTSRPFVSMTAPRRFPSSDLGALDALKSLGVRAGAEHRYTWIWVVVVEGRVFVRSWNDAPTGWYRALRAAPLGSIAIGRKPSRELAVRARPVRSERMREAVSRAYARKYDTPGSRKYVRGFAEVAREMATLELVPA